MSVGKMSVRQDVFRQNVFRQSVFRQNVRVPNQLIREIISAFTDVLYLAREHK
jgi:hypothetical protein